jgi:monofunctional biosynthetic peptidoglycan transglycosylase
LLGLVALAALALLWQVFTWPDVARLAEVPPESTAFMDAYQRRTGEAPRFRWVPYSSIDLDLKRAVVVSEDLEFFSHNGFSAHEMKAAVRDALDGKPLRGASTLTQQLAKNLWLTPSRNPWRKAKEAILTRQLEENLKKRRILEIYLNVVEFGPGIYGVEAAARAYFDRPASALTPRQAARLAAALPNPTRWNPAEDSAAARRRTERILARMAQTDWLTQLL